MTRASCPDIRRWQALLDNSAGEEAGGDVTEHLESCGACQQCLEILAAEPVVWQDTQHLAERSRDEPALAQMVQRLKNDASLRTDDLDLSFLVATDNPSLLGVLGPYEVQEEIGRGGMGVVLKANDPALNRVVAIKVLAPCLASSVKARQRFLREGRAAAAVAHENIVPVYCVSEAAGLPYLVMQYVAGVSLQDRLDRPEPLALEDIVRMGLQTATGLAAAHAQGLIHRDIKPANLLLDNDGARVKITDFGLARIANDTLVTQAGVVAGTPEFMAPEQARGDPIDHRADLFSLGSVLYAMCTRMPPFGGSTTLSVLRQVSDRTPIPIHMLNPQASPWLEEFIERLMEKDPARRLQSAAEAAALLEKYLAHLRQPAAVSAPSLPPSHDSQDRPGHGRWAEAVRRCRPRSKWALVGSLALATLLAVLWFLRLSDMLPGQLAPAQQAHVAAFYHDFRGGRALPAGFRLTGADAAVTAQPEDAGFRITVPANQEQRVRVGLEMFPIVEGDFEITAGYEILHADRPQSGEGVGFEFYIGTAPMVDGLGVLRLARLFEGDVYMVSRSTNQDGKIQFKHTFKPTQATSGRMRMTRRGAEVAVSAAEGAADDFRELCRYDLGPEDVGVIWLNAFVGASPHGVDLRIIDLKIQAGEVVADSVVPPADPGAAITGSRGWLTAVILMGFVVTISFIGLWRYLRRARPAASGNDDRTIEVPTLAAADRLVPIACPGCAKALRVKTDVVGKKVKCPKCNRTFCAALPEVAKRGLRHRPLAFAVASTLIAGALIVAILAWPTTAPPPPRSFFNTALGSEPLPDVPEEGFYFQEQFDGRQFRWTNGHARLTIPLDPDKLPDSLAMEIFAFRPRHINQVHLQIKANGRDLFNENIPVPPWAWENTFDLRDVELGKELVLEIVSDTFVPIGNMPPNDDGRTLGVQVRSIRLLRNDDKAPEAGP